jgi:hypothetical protein
MLHSQFWVIRFLVICVLSVLFIQVSDSHSQEINDVIEQFDLSPQMISYHSDGEWFMSNRTDGDNPFELLRISGVKTNDAKIDTLDFGHYLNVSKLSNDGDQLLYGFLDTLQAEPQRRTYMRRYENGSFSEPIDFREESGLNALTYFMIDEPGNVYFYTYNLDPKGIYRIDKTDNGYKDPKLLISNRPNYVAFSPLLLDEDTLLLAQHGQDDNSVNGIYVSKRKDGEWVTPVKLKDLPYGWSLGFGENDSIIYLIAESRMVMQVPMDEIEGLIDETL